MKPSNTIQALGVSPGIGIGTALLLQKTALTISEQPVAAVAEELQRLEQSLQEVIAQTKDLMVQADQAGEQSKVDILDAYCMLIEDPAVTQSAKNYISEKQYNAAHAVQQGMNQVIEMFESMDDDYMRERAFDIRDIQQRLLENLLGVTRQDLSVLAPNTVIVSDDLTTSDTAGLDFKNVCGILTCGGGENSHASIMARNFSIPALAGVKNALQMIADQDTVIVDGSAGIAYLHPTENVLAALKQKQTSYRAEQSRLAQYRGRPSVTADGHEVEICANIGTTVEVGSVLEHTADGIGLFRSEFLYLQRGRLPDEQTQFEAYKEVVMAMSPKPVIVRTMDIGGDKELPYLHFEKEENPFLGYRAIRICLDKPDLFTVQLRALLRASHYGNLKIMFPMISSLEELLEAKQLLEAAKTSLREENLPFHEKIPVGIMIEVPAAAILSADLAKECDFFSIGTNDLIQYTTAVDRGNETIAPLYSPYHPAILRLIALTIKSAHEANIPCGMCGEAAGNPLLIPVLLGMGLDEFSMSAGMVLSARKLIASINTNAASSLSEQVLQLSSQSQVKALLKEKGNVP